MDLSLELYTVFIGFLLVGNVAGQTNCTVGDLIEASEQAILFDGQGMLYLDADNPAPCSGLITSWRFCHYPRFINQNADQNYSALIQIWTPQDEPGRYTWEFQTILEDTVPRQTPEDLTCIDVPLDEVEQVPIEENDILAVYIPGLTLGLRMLSQNLPNSRLYATRPSGGNIGGLTDVTLSSVDTLTQHGIHLRANIVNSDTTDAPTFSTTNSTTDSNVDNSTTEPTEVPTTPPTNTTGGPQQGTGGGLSGGGIAAIIIVLLILIGAAVVVTVIAVVIWYKKCRGSSWEKNMKRKQQEDGISIDNAVYDEGPVRANSAMAQYLNSTFSSTGPTTDYEVPIATKSKNGGLQPSAPPRNGMESMYVEMDSAEGVQKTGHESTDFVDSFETYPGSEGQPYEVQKRYHTQPRRKTDAVFDIYRSYGPDNEIYCQFMEETVSQTSSLPHGVVQHFDPYADPPTNEEDIHKNLSIRTRTIDRNEIREMGEIGSGQFAYVNKALWMEKTGISLTVAVKTLHSTASQEEKIKLLQEADIMGQFIHPNVARLIGVVRSNSETSLVTEYCAKGDLSALLKDMSPGQSKRLPPDTSRNLLSYSQQVALAMHYLSSKGFVHRDLAARNIFVTQENICKLGDFGMSRDLANAEYYLSQGGAIPVRWTAPEAIYYSKYSTASDVWSYGCLLFEIWSVGKKPFGGLPNTEVLETIKTGYRLPPPPGCPKAFYKIMIQCWHPESGSRPVFRDVLESLLKDDKEILHIPNEDASVDPQATELGAPLEAGKAMYLSLQHSYLSSPPTNKRETIYEAIEEFSSGSFKSSFPKPPLTPQSSFTKATPPLPTKPIPKAPLTQKGSILSIGSQATPPGTPPIPSSPRPTKPPVAKKPSTASLSSPKPSPLHSTKSPLVGQMSAPIHPSYADSDELYDDIVGVRSSDSMTQQGDDIYDDIADGPNAASIPKASIYEVPSDAQASNPYDLDYEDI